MKNHIEVLRLITPALVSACLLLLGLLLQQTNNISDIVNSLRERMARVEQALNLKGD